MRIGRYLVGVVGVVLLALALSAAPGMAESAASLQTIASGLNNPRGLALGSDGGLYVAEAGRGGTGPCVQGPEGPQCFGLSGSITRIDLWRGRQERVVTGLPSLADNNGSSATGPHDISFSGRGVGYIAIGLGGNPTARTTNFGAGGANLGQLMRGVLYRGWRNIADVSGYEAQANPDQGAVDSNPYSVLAWGDRQIVADAGGNAVVQVDERGRMTTLAVFPNRMVAAPPFLGLPPGSQIPMQSVPTSVALGPDGKLYVGELTGFPFPVGAANVYRVPLTGGTPEVFASGFTNIVDIAFGPDGSLYVVEIAKNGLLAAEQGGDQTGALIRVSPNGTQTEIASAGLVAPGGVAIGPYGTLYVTNKSILAGQGEVVRVQP